MDDLSDDFYDGLLDGLFWFFWPKGPWQWLFYIVLFCLFTYLKSK
ncbi:MAG: hypothetical protein ACRYFZ_19400 [Janthinobacterium lividum]